MTRTVFTQSMQEMQEEMLSLGSMVEKAVARSIEALRTQNVELAQQVIEYDEHINAQRWKIEENSTLLIATQAPLARDLRYIFAVMHIATELERMADYAQGIAKLTLRIVDEPLLKPLVDLPRMADIGRELLMEALDAFIEQDAERARQIARRDDEVDQLYEQVYRELLTFMISDPRTVPRATHLLWVAHNLERIADRVTNICERTVFSVTGDIEEMG
ncbi:phosphate signaling complex protein PhoU [soil metagenome]